MSRGAEAQPSHQLCRVPCSPPLVRCSVCVALADARLRLQTPVICACTRLWSAAPLLRCSAVAIHAPQYQRHGHGSHRKDLAAFCSACQHRGYVQALAATSIIGGLLGCRRCRRCPVRAKCVCVCVWNMYRSATYSACRAQGGGDGRPVVADCTWVFRGLGY